MSELEKDNAGTLHAAGALKAPDYRSHADARYDGLEPQQLSEGRGKLVVVPIEQILCDPFVRPRKCLDRSVVQEYCEHLKADGSFPALQVVALEEGFLLVDGYLRLEAAKRAGLNEMRCVVHDGGRREAIMMSASANVRHGQRRTDADKHRAVSKLLLDAEWRQWSDHRIARYCGVSQPFVSGLRNKMVDTTDNIIGDNRTRRYINKHRRQATMRLPDRQRGSLVCDSNPPAAQSGEAVRAGFVDQVERLEELIRATDVAAIWSDQSANDQLSAKLRALAERAVAMADMLSRRD